MISRLLGAYNLHSQGIVHRDLKPSNILLNVDNTVVTDDDDDDDEALMVESDDGSFDTASEQGHQRRGRSNTYRPQRHDHSTDVAKLVIADFSSALSSEVLHDLHLFGAGGPSKDELTLQYTPPEVLFNLSTSSSRRRSSLNDSSHAEEEELYGEAYDAWSIGVIFLEIILGTADVFSVDQRTSAMIAHRLRGYSAEMIDQAMLLASFAEYCIYDGHSIHATSSSSSSMKTARGDNATSSSSASAEKAIVEGVSRGDSSGQYNQYREFLSKISSPKYHSSIHLPRKSTNQGSEEGEGEPKEKKTTKKCGLPELSKAIQRRDPLGTGFTHGGGEDGNYAIDLIARLLRWDPSQRLSLDRALQHAYFVGPYISKHDNTSHPTLDELYKHDARYLKDQPLQHKSLPLPYRTRHATDSTDVDDSSSAAALTTHSLSLLTAPISRLMSRSNNNNNNNNNNGGEDNEDNDRYRYPSEGPSRHHTADESWHSTSSEQHDLPKEDDATILDGDKPHVVHTDDNDDDDNDDDEEEKAVLMHVGGITVEVGDDVDDTNRLAFTCPKCGRKFVGDWNSCDKHVKSRKHGRRCSYSHDSTTDDDRGEGSTTAAALPDCISHHSMLPIDEQSGWCDLKGRRKHMEDAHAIVFADDNRLFHCLIYLFLLIDTYLIDDDDDND